MRQALLTAWARRGWLACFLWPLSILFGLIVRSRRWLYRAQVFKTQRVGVPVIVVGNVVAGGAGKTPMVIALVEHLRARGVECGVISRGYGRSTTDCREVKPGDAASDVGDEPLLVARACGVPVFVARRRIEAACALLAAYPATHVLICDDGLQHYALGRDIEICLFDERGTGNGFLLPAGPLREPWPRVVDFVLHTGDAPAFEGYRASRALASYAHRADGHRVELASLAARPVIAVAGIARPGRFFSMLESRGFILSKRIPLPDHHDFAGWQPPDATSDVLCTEKDAVKLWSACPGAWAVPLEFKPDAAMLKALDALLDAKLSSRHASN